MFNYNILGGWNLDEGVLDSVELYDAKPNSRCNRRNLAKLPGPRRGLVAAWIDDKVGQ